MRSDLQNLTGVIINVLGCDTILSGRFTANILKEPAAPPSFTPKQHPLSWSTKKAAGSSEIPTFIHQTTLQHDRKNIKFQIQITSNTETQTTSGKNKYATCFLSTETLISTNMSCPKYCHANFTATRSHGFND